jgi:hypothetical protein
MRKFPLMRAWNVNRNDCNDEITRIECAYFKLLHILKIALAVKTAVFEFADEMCAPREYS